MGQFPRKRVAKNLAPVSRRELKVQVALSNSASRKMREGHWELFRHELWGKKFWSSGYFHRTVGVVTSETVKHYVAESQKKHWKKPQIREQQTLLSYAS